MIWNQVNLHRIKHCNGTLLHSQAAHVHAVPPLDLIRSGQVSQVRSGEIDQTMDDNFYGSFNPFHSLVQCLRGHFLQLSVIEPGTRGTGPDLWLLHGPVLATIEPRAYSKQAHGSSWLTQEEDLRKHTSKTSVPHMRSWGSWGFWIHSKNVCYEK